MLVYDDEDLYTIVYNGESYERLPSSSRNCEKRGHHFRTNCDTEVLLFYYIEWGLLASTSLTAFLLSPSGTACGNRSSWPATGWASSPCLYSLIGGTFIFGSEPKALLQHPKVEPVVGPEGLAEIFIIGPARTPGQACTATSRELRAGHAMILPAAKAARLRTYPYWKLDSYRHEEDTETSRRCGSRRAPSRYAGAAACLSTCRVCTLLSGGLDSSALTALAVQYYNRTGARDGWIPIRWTTSATTKHFKSHAFQPGADAPWIQRMVEESGTRHHFIEFEHAGADRVAETTPP
ncbi:asparagine synthase-related protein [Paenibacillus sp. JTLBN-2024]